MFGSFAQFLFVLYVTFAQFLWIDFPHFLVYLKFPATASRDRFLRNHRDLSTHRRGDKCLPKTSRPGLIPTVRPDLPQSTHCLEEEETLRSILFLRLKTCHLQTSDIPVEGTGFHCRPRKILRSGG